MLSIGMRRLLNVVLAGVLGLALTGCGPAVMVAKRTDGKGKQEGRKDDGDKKKGKKKGDGKKDGGKKDGKRGDKGDKGDKKDGKGDGGDKKDGQDESAGTPQQPSTAGAATPPITGDTSDAPEA